MIVVVTVNYDVHRRQDPGASRELGQIPPLDRLADEECTQRPPILVIRRLRASPAKWSVLFDAELTFTVPPGKRDFAN